jgi:hypothetical protein
MAGVQLSEVSAASRLVLITAREASLPTSRDADISMRGITRGPKVSLVSPPSEDVAVSSPLHLRVRFETYGGARIDTDSVRVLYLKTPVVDLTPRIKPYWKDSEIDVEEAEVPAGRHVLRIDVKDTDGRASSAQFTLNISK